MSLGEKIQQLRKAAGLSQEQLADRLGVSRQAVSKWERDESVPDVDKIILISSLFGLSTDELLKENKTDSPDNKTPGENPQPPLSEMIELNLANRQVAIGFCTVIFGLVLLVLEYLFLPVFGLIHKTVVNGQGFYTDAIRYAGVQPMPVIFALTALIILAGVSFLAIGLYSKKKKDK